MTDYQKQGTDFLAAHEIEFRAVLVGDDCPGFCEDAQAERDMDKASVYPRKTHIHGKHYRVTFSAKGRGHLTVDFWNSYADEEENAFAFGEVAGPKENVYWDKYRIGGKYPGGARARKRIVPTPYDVLACLEKNDPGTFEDFCAGYGYDSDSRRAEQTYHSVVREWNKLRKFFTDAELAELQEIS